MTAVRKRIPDTRPGIRFFDVNIREPGSAHPPRSGQISLNAYLPPERASATAAIRSKA